MWGGGAAKMATQAIPPPPRCGIPPKIRGIWQSRQFPTWQGVPEVAKMLPNFSKMSAKCRHGKSCDKCGCEGRSHQFPANSLINGYNKKPFSQNRGGELLSTLLQCQSLPTSFPTSWESEYSAYIVNSPLYKLRRGGNSASVSVASFYRQHLCGGYWTIKNKAGHNSTRGTVSSLLFSPWKVLLHTVYIFNIFNMDWG